MQDHTIKPHLKSAAQSFAGATAVDVSCHQYLLDSNKKSKAVLRRYYHQQLCRHYPKLKPHYTRLVIEVALAELSYPTLDTAKWSGRERAALAGISRSTWYRLGLCPIVNRITTHIHTISLRLTKAVNCQLNDTGSTLDRVMVQVEF